MLIKKWGATFMRAYQERIASNLKPELPANKCFCIIGELIDDGVTCAEIARHSGIADYTIRHHARMHKKLSIAVKQLFIADKISFSLARAIAGLPQREQENAARKAIAKSTSVQAFRVSLNMNDDIDLNKELQRLADQLSSLSGLDIHILADRNDAHAGSWVIRYSDLTMFDTISEKILGGRSLEEF